MAANTNLEDLYELIKNPNLKDFYELTKPTFKNIYYIWELVENHTNSTNDFLRYRSVCLGMLAHLNIDSDGSLSEGKKLLLDDSDFDWLCSRLQVAKRGTLKPAAVPIIQRYRKVFDEYEKQNGLVSFYKQREKEKNQQENNKK